jgi:hypothetical protein
LKFEVKNLLIEIRIVMDKWRSISDSAPEPGLFMKA